MDERKTKRHTLFLQRLTGAKERLLNSIAGVDPAVLCSEPVFDDWTVKDIFGHIVSWNKEFRDDIRLIQQGKHPGYEHHISGEDDFNQWNQQQKTLKSARPWECIRDDFDRDYQEAVQLILSLDSIDFRKRGVTPWKKTAKDRQSTLTTTNTESMETLVTYHWRHMNQHARSIEKWRKRRKEHRNNSSHRKRGVDLID
jgi:hypothetical protein